MPFVGDTSRKILACRQLTVEVERWKPTSSISDRTVIPPRMNATLTKAKRIKPGYEPIFVSPTESWTSGRFIDHFLTANRFAVSPANRELVRVVMRAYPGPRPIIASDISAYLLRHFSTTKAV